MSIITEQYVYIDTPEGPQKMRIHPVTEVKAISDIGDALDAYKENYIDPSIPPLVDDALTPFTAKMQMIQCKILKIAITLETAMIKEDGTHDVDNLATVRRELFDLIYQLEMGLMDHNHEGEEHTIVQLADIMRRELAQMMEDLNQLKSRPLTTIEIDDIIDKFLGEDEEDE